MHGRPPLDDNRALRSIPPARVALIEEISSLAGRRKGRGVASTRKLRRRFLETYFHSVAEEDLSTRSPQALAAAALHHLDFGSRRRMPSEARVRVFNPDSQRDGFESPHTVVMIVTDDMPFLVDSVGIVFARAGLAVHLIVHPVIEVRRDGRGRLTDIGANGAAETRAESWQLYEIDRQTDPAQIDQLQQQIETTLGEVRVVV
jgi:glutamate dehydrogenase